MYKLRTQLAYFRYNSIPNTGIIYVTWFLLGSEDEGRCFTHDEMNKFLDFAVQHPLNFPNAKNYESCKEDDAPYCDIYSDFSNDNSSLPKNLFLRKSPQLSKAGHKYECMDIILTNETLRDNHTYSLNFDVIGRIED